MPTGVIKVRKDGGYGFIAPDEGGKDVFFHVHELRNGTDEALACEGARVGYDVRQGDRGLMAVKVRIMSAEPEAAPQYTGQAAYTEDEAWAGLKQALLASLEWVDVLERLSKERRA